MRQSGRRSRLASRMSTTLRDRPSGVLLSWLAFISLMRSLQPVSARQRATSLDALVAVKKVLHAGCHGCEDCAGRSRLHEEKRHPVSDDGAPRPPGRTTTRRLRAVTPPDVASFFRLRWLALVL